ncbi:ATP-dependent DNA/RNA helicase DHX36-like [Plodia interpunctella]|uniref:ATP-dependent DNA/RNA helicase DHX36-like n=1 Tax=Plodia interpunctella TaxID=58824 RepID=UPI0023681171|nr:ATP-dependent DNA/RNA helicase DHX36-like [Plodia interpunctella]
MSGRGRGNWRYQNRRGRGRGTSWGDRSFEPGSSSKDGIPPERRPRNLRGKDIGLYYRDRHIKVAKERGNSGSMRKKQNPEDYILNLKIPKVVAQKLDADLKIILKLANRSLKEKDDESVLKNECDSETDDFVFKKPKLPDTSNNSAPNTSSTPDFIPVNNELPSDYGNDRRQLSLRGAGDFKYGYEDIITGSFDQKLDECLSNGIKINESNIEIKDLNIALHNDYMRMLQDSRYKRYLEFRKKLPTYSKTKELLEVIKDNQVIVISGETGCGKSTQVPQIILDDAIANFSGGNVKILVTQPRRIAALSLASRVAEERGEKLGSSVGYVVRLERVDCRDRGSITFCTTGVLLVDLEIDQGLTKYSHIILDEVHERDTHIDLAMCMLKKVLNKRHDLKLILMSATIDADKLSAFYNNCPMMHIEGLAYPVQDIYLEDILQTIKFELSEPVNDRNFTKRRWKRYLKRYSEESMCQKAIQYRAEVGPWLESQKKAGKIDEVVYKTLSDHRIEDLNMELILELVLYICRGPPGAVLIFFPGIGEITKLLKLMRESKAFPPNLYNIYPLHSKLSTVEQHKIFQTPPQHIRKIIVATNIAETSITIDDIVYVIDCGKIKYNGLNIENYISTLQTQWVSKANLRQRRGRAGRCQPGVCYHLLTSFRAEQLEERLLPELQRSNLLEPVLQVKRLRLGLADTAFQLVPDAPDLSTVQRAVNHLQKLGALDDKETLTPLGWHLARLPVHPAAGKLLILGTLLGCLDRAASVAAVWSFKDPFLMVIGQTDLVEDAKKNMALGEPSDHVAMSEAFIQWENIPPRARRDFAYNNFLAHNTLELLSDMKKQLGDNLKQMGFLASGDVRSPWENRNANNLSVFKAVVAAALYPNIGAVRWIGINSRKNKPRIKVQTPENGNIQVHPSSVMYVKRKGGGKPTFLNNPGANWLVYWLKQRSTELFLIDVTLVHTLPLLFFGELKIVEMKEENCLMSISAYKVSCPKAQADLLIELRKSLDDVLASKICSHHNKHSTTYSYVDEYVLKAVIDIITAEDEGVEYFDEDDDTTGSECDHESDLND